MAVGGTMSMISFVSQGDDEWSMEWPASPKEPRYWRPARCCRPIWCLEQRCRPAQQWAPRRR